MKELMRKLATKALYADDLELAQDISNARYRIDKLMDRFHAAIAEARSEPAPPRDAHVVSSLVRLSDHVVNNIIAATAHDSEGDEYLKPGAIKEAKSSMVKLSEYILAMAKK